MIRNAGPSSDRGRISPNGCLSLIISPNWAWAACTPLAPGSLAIWWNDKFVSGAQSLVIPPGLGAREKLWPRAAHEQTRGFAKDEAGDTMSGRGAGYSDASRPGADRLFGEIL